MNIEFHYYILYILAKHAGLPEYDCITLAYSSQYVDNNLVGHRIHTDTRVYETSVTHNYGWWSDWFPAHVYIPFHFFPGDLSCKGARRKDGKTNTLNCTAGGAFVRGLVRRAFDTKNLYRMGIAIHTFADSWAHQNFTGGNDSWNTISQDSPIPKVGHADAISQPDIMTLKWIDPRLDGEGQYIDNLVRFLDAAANIYSYLCQFSGKWMPNNRLGGEGGSSYAQAAEFPPDWEKVRDRLKQFIGPFDPANAKQAER
ncbi:MAG: hypothetical protein EHM28_10570, partial [Spirochaetaceae bacterium]